VVTEQPLHFLWRSSCELGRIEQKVAGFTTEPANDVVDAVTAES
jgi:hypothetical protein